MRGTEVTKEQMESASQFLADRGWPEGAPLAQAKREQIVRLVAWYGACRYQAGAAGINSWDCPGELAVKPARSALALCPSVAPVSEG